MQYKISVPKSWNKDLAYFFGLLIGDGSLPLSKSIRPNGQYQKRYCIYFICNSRKFLDEVYLPIFKLLFELTPHITQVKGKKNLLFNCRIHSKQIYEFLTSMGYISGRKAKIAKVPQTLPKKYYPDILAGLLDTDGGKKGSGFGLSTASEQLALFCMDMFKTLKIPYHSCPWRYKEHIYHQIYVHKRDMDKILKSIPLKNTDKINFIQSYMPQ